MKHYEQPEILILGFTAEAVMTESSFWDQLVGTGGDGNLGGEIFDEDE